MRTGHALTTATSQAVTNRLADGRMAAAAAALRYRRRFLFLKWFSSTVDRHTDGRLHKNTAVFCRSTACYNNAAVFCRSTVYSLRSGAGTGLPRCTSAAAQRRTYSTAHEHRCPRKAAVVLVVGGLERKVPGAEVPGPSQRRGPRSRTAVQPLRLRPRDPSPMPRPRRLSARLRRPSPRRRRQQGRVPRQSQLRRLQARQHPQPPEIARHGLTRPSSKS
jgi:hypothetical protein